MVPKYKRTAVVRDTQAGARDGWGPPGVTGWVAERAQMRPAVQSTVWRLGGAREDGCWGILG